MVYKTFYKDRPAVAVGDGRIEALFLPEDGGKLASLKLSGKELLAVREGEKYLRLGMDTSYVKSECSAFDDMFPTIDPCVIDGMSYPDHGEVSRSELSCTLLEGAVRLECRVRSVGARFIKTAFVEDGALCIKYEIENGNDFDLPYIWAGHIMLRGECGARIESAFTDTDSVSVAFGQPPKSDPCRLREYGSGKEYKFYYDAPCVPMRCSVVYPDGGRVRFDFEGECVKYLGVWLNPGDLNGTYNVAVEPCTAPYDTPIRAAEQAKGSVIAAKSKVEFTLKINGDT